MADAPRILVSSTYYDLKQIRADLSHFIETDLGYRCLLSERDSFPIDPDADTIENCRRRVWHDTDIMVLLIGGRYGFVPEDTQKSVTNIEYSIARERRIPIYAFVDKQTHANMPTWAKNPDADFSSCVDNPKVFEFIRQVSKTDSVWTREFEQAEDITRSLRHQFGSLFGKLLQLNLKLNNSPAVDSLDGLSGECLRLVLESPRSWRIRLFAQALIEEVGKHRDAQRALELGIAWGAGEILPSSPAQLGAWVVGNLDDLQRDMSNFQKLLDGKMGILTDSMSSQNINDTIFFARQIAAYFRSTIDWSLRLRRCHCPEPFRNVVDALAVCVDDVIRDIEALGTRCLKELEEAHLKIALGGPSMISFKVELRLKNTEQVMAAIENWRVKVAAK